MSTEPFTQQDRKDIISIVPAMITRMFDEFAAAESIADMHTSLAELVIKIALTGDEIFGSALASKTTRLSHPEADLARSCKRILGSGRFDFYGEE